MYLCFSVGYLQAENFAAVHYWWKDSAAKSVVR